MIISGDGMKKELFYVAASRGRKEVTVFTASKLMLRHSAGVSAARLSASELSRALKPGLQFGLHRGFQAACRMLKRAAELFESAFQKAPSLEPVKQEHQTEPESLQIGLENENLKEALQKALPVEPAKPELKIKPDKETKLSSTKMEVTNEFGL